ncbi:MAG: hypothetical protein ACE5HT_16255 [Gemmatimonadales bacterium]
MSPWKGRRRFRRALPCAVVVALAALACEPGPITQVDPNEQASGEGSDVPQVQRGLVTIHASVDPADSALADSLGWQDGVPGVEIHFLRNGTGEWLTTTTDSTGTASFSKVLPGLYRLFGGRTLTEAEAANVGGVVRAFGDGRTVRIGRSGMVELQLLADRPGSLVISEMVGGVPLFQDFQGSTTGMLYFEVYNNSAANMFLDGKIFGVSHDAVMNLSFSPCSFSQQVRTDPAGVYDRWFLQFPGSGTDYPIGPGEAKLVAVEAIDHRPAHPTMPDLSNADFEIGDGANNPGVPDMLSIGPVLFSPRLAANLWTYILTEPFDVASLSVVWRGRTGRQYYRVPKELYLDAIALRSIWEPFDSENEPCIPMMARDFDRYEGGFPVLGRGIPDQALRSYQRKVLRIGPDGRKILMNTNTSAVDFGRIAVPRTPGWIP